MPLDKIRPFEEALLLDLRNHDVEVLHDIRDSKDLSGGTEGKLKAAVERVAKQFA
jgi:F-type H+-transporting ATPase subunit alpha